MNRIHSVMAGEARQSGGLSNGLRSWASRCRFAPCNGGKRKIEGDFS
jgi:hypothetical protein